MCNHNYILTIMMLCNLEIGAAASSDGHKEFVESLSAICGSESTICTSEDMDVVDGHCSSDEECDSEISLHDDSIVVETNVQSDLPVFGQYYYVDKLPYADQNKDDALLWRARLQKGVEAVEAHRIVGAKSFIDVLKARFHSYKKEALIDNVMAGVGGEYVESDDSDIYNTRLDHVKKVITTDRLSEMSCCYAQSEDRDYLGLPLSVRGEVDHMREFPRKTHYTHAEFSEWVQARMAWIHHEGSYIVEVVPGSTKQFLAECVERVENIPFTEWQLVQTDE